VRPSRLKVFRFFDIVKTYSLDGLTVCCDHVDGLGEYVEVESSSAKDRLRILDVLGRLGVGEKATTRTYAELLNL
jgi:adenylate cyclase class IV